MPPFKLGRLVERIHFIGFRSLTIVILTGAFTGMVLGLQIFLDPVALRLRGASSARRWRLPSSASWAPCSAPSSSPGCAGSALTAEIGIMRITEQIDALTVMALTPDALPRRARHRRRGHHASRS